jgi:hypothetical protein
VNTLTDLIIELVTDVVSGRYTGLYEALEDREKDVLAAVQATWLVDEVFPPEEILEWVRKHQDPEDVFDARVLKKWALDNAFREQERE